MNTSLRISHILLSSIVILYSAVSAQDFYPLHQGDVWNYHIFYYGRQDTLMSEIRITSDTLMPNGRTYRRLSNSDFLSGQYIRKDSANIYYYSLHDSTESRIFNLLGQVGTRDTIHWRYYYTSRITSIYTSNLFGRDRQIRQYVFGGLAEAEVWLVEGIGIFQAYDYGDGAWPFAFFVKLNGCMINDTLYGTLVGVDSESVQPDYFILQQNYPNPFNPTTVIEFDIPKRQKVRLVVSNIIGQEVAQYINNEIDAGRHRILVNARDLSSGIYFYSLITSSGSLTRKMIVLK